MEVRAYTWTETLSLGYRSDAGIDLADDVKNRIKRRGIRTSREDKILQREEGKEINCGCENLLGSNFLTNIASREKMNLFNDSICDRYTLIRKRVL